MASKHKDQIIKELKALVGDENFISDGQALQAAQTSTYTTDRTILGIVKPDSVVQIQQVLKIARRDKIPVYTYSTGKNWGYGSRIPQTKGSLLIELSRMNKILDYDEELGYVTIEPGVTQKQVYNFLEEHGGSYGISMTSSAPDTSVMGNICERGVGLGPYGFRSHYISNLEVVLPSGKCIHTGFGRFTNAKSADVYPEGLGPSFNDMFIQSNYGIITKLTTYLVPMPTYSRHINIVVEADGELSKYLDAIRKFNFYSNTRKVFSFATWLGILLSEEQYPWHMTDNKTPLSVEAQEWLKEKHNVDYAWKGRIAIYGYTQQEIAAQIEYFDTLAKGLNGITISPLYDKGALGAKPRPLSQSPYWRMRTVPPEIKNPDTDGCGLIRLSMAVPFRSSDITNVIKLMKDTLTQFKYEPFIEGHCVSERMAIVIALIVFDRTMPGENENALACHDMLLAQLAKSGYYPYRDNGRAMSLLAGSSDDYDDFQKIIKNAIDPDNIMSPGRYENQNARLNK